MTTPAPAPLPHVKRTLLGFDIGGTKCAVIVGQTDGPAMRILKRTAFPTGPDPQATLLELESVAHAMIESLDARPAAIGISCGGPLDSRRGLILSPPNLPGWDAVPVCEHFAKAFRIPAHLQNDANACALAEWRRGAGRGVRSMVFLTFGTGMGAGLILDGKLYSGVTDSAGEVGHVRLAEDGPEGFGKRGSFEGFCSGGGMVRLAREFGWRAKSAQEIFEAAASGDPVALRTVRTTAHQLGRGLALLVDLLNPERIVIGSIFARQHAVLWPTALQALRAEALATSLAACEVVPASLGEEVGDYAALSVAEQAFA